MTETIETISDTALWVAAYRAMETERPDAIFHDVYAAGLAGERGRAIMQSMPHGKSIAWALVVRTKVFDELMLELVQSGEVDTVLNLGAGLDTRPYRLVLPSSLRWIEADMSAMVAYKTERLAQASPRCALERVAVDIEDALARARLWERLGGAEARVLVVTEGLLGYLDEALVATLADELWGQPSVRFWALEVWTPELAKRQQQMWGKRLRAGNADFKFTPPGGADFYRRHGWRVRTSRFLADEAKRLNRQMRISALTRMLIRVAPQSLRERFRRMVYYAVLERDATRGNTATASS